MRQGGHSLNAAAREQGVNPKTVARLADSGLRKQSNGRYAARKNDRLLRVLYVPTRSGVQDIAAWDSRSASLVADYWNAVHWFLDTGDDSRLRPFRGKSVTTSDGTRIPLLTNLDDLEHLGSAGVFSFESIYARAA